MHARCCCVLTCTEPHSVMLIFDSLCHAVTSSCLKMTSLVGPMGAALQGEDALASSSKCLCFLSSHQSGLQELNRMY